MLTKMRSFFRNALLDHADFVSVCDLSHFMMILSNHDTILRI